MKMMNAMPAMPPTEHIGVLFADLQNSSKLEPPVAWYFRNHVLPLLAPRISHHLNSLIDLNTWGDGLFATSTDLSTIAYLAMDIRDFFLHPGPWQGVVKDLKIRIALDSVDAHLETDALTGKNGYKGPHLTRAARMESVTAPNSVFVTKFFHDRFVDGGGINLDLRPLSDELHLPKGFGITKAYSLHRGSHEPAVAWSDQKSHLKAIAPMAVDSFFLTPKTGRHDTARDRLKEWGERVEKNKEEVEVCFINVTGKSVIFPDLKGDQRLTDHSIVAAAIERGVRFRGIVMDPYCDEALLRSHVESPNKNCPAERLLQMDGARVAGIPNSEWSELWEKKSSSLRLKKTRYGLPFSLWLFPDCAIIEPYHLGKLPDQGKQEHMCKFSQLHIFKKRQEEFEMLKEHFENMWKHSTYVWPQFHGPTPEKITSALHPLHLNQRLADAKRSPGKNLQPIRLLHLVSNTLKIGKRLQKAFDQLPKGFSIRVHTDEAEDYQTPDEFLLSTRLTEASFVLLQVHGAERERRLLESALKMMPREAKAIVYIHRPEELILRIALENNSDYRAAKLYLADLLSGCHAIILSGQCFVPEYQDMLPDVLVTAIPLGFVPPASSAVDLSARLDKRSVTFIGSAATTWGEMRHLEDLSQLIEAIELTDSNAKFSGYAAGNSDKHCNLREFIQRRNVVLVSNAEILDAFQNKAFEDEDGFRSWLHDKAPGKCILRVRTEANGEVVWEKMPEDHQKLRQWEDRLIDFNLQLYHEILDHKRGPDRRGLPKVEYSGTLHKGEPHELFVVFKSPAMEDVERDEEFRMIQAPIVDGNPDFARTAQKVLHLIRTPRERREMIEHNQRSTAKLGMEEVAFAFCLLIRHLA